MALTMKGAFGPPSSGDPLVKVELLRACYFGGVRREIGDVVEVDWRLANEVIHNGKAKAAPAEPAPPAPEPEPEAKPPTRRKSPPPKDTAPC